MTDNPLAYINQLRRLNFSVFFFGETWEVEKENE